MCQRRPESLWRGMYNVRKMCSFRIIKRNVPHRSRNHPRASSDCVWLCVQSLSASTFTQIASLKARRKVGTLQACRLFPPFLIRAHAQVNLANALISCIQTQPIVSVFVFSLRFRACSEFGASLIKAELEQCEYLKLHWEAEQHGASTKMSQSASIAASHYWECFMQQLMNGKANFAADQDIWNLRRLAFCESAQEGTAFTCLVDIAIHVYKYFKGWGKTTKWEILQSFQTSDSWLFRDDSTTIISSFTIDMKLIFEQFLPVSGHAWPLHVKTFGLAGLRGCQNMA